MKSHSELFVYRLLVPGRRENPAAGVSESEPHWMYCSKFLLAALSHLTLSLENLDERDFLSAEEYHRTRSIANLLVRKAEMVFTSHLAYWSAYTHTQTAVG